MRTGKRSTEIIGDTHFGCGILQRLAGGTCWRMAPTADRRLRKGVGDLDA
jgi:hypothetical protein